MKKYIGLLIVLGILTFGATKVQAVVSVDNNMGCLPSYRYSPITGQPCSSILPIPVTPPIVVSPTLDTTPRIMYWYGKVNQHVDVNGNWQTDPDGISGADLDKLTYCKKWFPRTIRVEDYKLETTNGWRNRGNVDAPYTSTKMSTKCVQREGMVIPIPVDNPVISGISGPQFLDVNSVGTWKVEAYNPTGGNLSYKVDWGDTYEYCPVGGPCTRALSLVEAPFGQSATFTHRYLRDGVYNPTFTVRNDKGGTATTSLSVKVGKTDSKPSITIISPNGGENFIQNNDNTIAYSYSAPVNEFIQIGLVDARATNNSNLVGNPYLLKGWISAPGGPGGVSPFTGSFNWGATEVCDLGFMNCWPVSPGEYKILVQMKDEMGNLSLLPSASNWDVSNRPFKISEGNNVLPVITPNASIKVLSPNGGEVFRGGEEIKVRWETKNIPKNELVAFYLDVPTGESLNIGNQGQFETINDGVEKITLPIISPNYGNQFKMHIVQANNSLTAPQDVSDNYFTIKNSEVNPIPIGTHEDCAPGSVYSRTTGQKCLTTQVQSNIQSSSAKIITRGTISNEVKTVQSALTKKGYPLTTDGNFGPKTEEAVKKFQTMKGLPVTGIIDDKTMSLLLSYLLAL